MKRIVFAALMLSGILISVSAGAQQKEVKKIEASASVLKEFGKMKESIPAQLLEVTEGIVIIPKMINAGLVIGGKRGKGLAMVKGDDGKWSDPVFITLTGGSFGFQAGVQSVDLVLIFKNKESLMDISKSSFTLGGDISVAAGPVGRSSSASTDYKLEAEVYSYSRSKGLFAGISLSGAALEIDHLAIEDYYKKAVSPKTLFSGSSRAKAPEVEKLRSTLSGLYQ
ncbi:lipid-binding SYLF domain-containing protein [Arcticibacter sp. MXS-1]|uniref:lipid-binding SYLF domain-containing protein n=1 Tax=Arcticibacter sp. MXS-1 TaxID=3341726 RepID=UPI0035A82E59